MYIAYKMEKKELYHIRHT